MAKRKKRSPASEAASILGRLGGFASAGKGGRKRWSKISAEERSKIMKAVRAGAKAKGKK